MPEREEDLPFTHPTPNRGTVGNATWGEEHPGRLTTYLDAGFEIVHRPSKRRAVVAVEF